MRQGDLVQPDAMIGLFDSGHGGLTVWWHLRERFPERGFMYLGDHGNAPYGNKPHADIVALTAHGVEALYQRGCKLVLLACNTATAIAGRTLQQEWLPAHYPDRKLLGIIAPTVEVATQTPWSIKTPQFPQKYNTDTLALFGTAATVESGVYETEIAKRCPRVKLVGQACPRLAGLIEDGAPMAELQNVVAEYVQALLARCDTPPDEAILGCTHYPLVAHLFRAALPPATRLLSQPHAVADALDDYLSRHPAFDASTSKQGPVFTTGDVATVNTTARRLGMNVTFEALPPSAK